MPLCSSSSSPVPCLSVCVMCMCMRGDRMTALGHACPYGSQKFILVTVSVVLHLIFETRPLTESRPCYFDYSRCSAKKKKNQPVSTPPHQQVYRCKHQIHLLCGYWVSKVRSSCLHRSPTELSPQPSALLIPHNGDYIST